MLDTSKQLTVAVCASTGTQGLSVVRALSQAPDKYRVLALTRSPSSASTLSVLSRFGPSVLPTYFNIDDVSSVRAAFKQADVVYAVTIPDPSIVVRKPGAKSTTGMLSEEEQGKRMADVAKEVGVELFLWSTLPDNRHLPGNADGKLPIIVREQKLAVNEYIKAIDLPAVFIELGFFNENLVKYQRLTKNDDGTLTYTLPHASLDSHTYAHTSIDRDLGPVVRLLIEHFNDRELNLNHKNVALVAGLWSNREVIAALEKATGRKVHLVAPDVFGEPGSYYDNMFKAMASEDSVIIDPARLPDPTLEKLGYRLQPFEEFAEETIKPLFA
ncbi:hypothetical protein JCM5296_000748 [Sporobolomyces johnsonii]